MFYHYTNIFFLSLFPILTFMFSSNLFRHQIPFKVVNTKRVLSYHVGNPFSLLNRINIAKSPRCLQLNNIALGKLHSCNVLRMLKMYETDSK